MGFASLFKKKQPASPQLKSQTTSSRLSTSFASRSPSNVSSGHQIQELQQVFRKFDVNGDGKISAAELGSIVSSLGHPVPEGELEKMIKEVDADGDGHIDFNEFVELNTKGVDSDEIMENLRDAFSVYDIDGNGAITAEELQEVLQSLGEDCSIGECRRMISGVDVDGDGTISFEEFKVMMMVGSRNFGDASSPAPNV